MRENLGSKTIDENAEAIRNAPTGEEYIEKIKQEKIDAQKEIDTHESEQSIAWLKEQEESEKHELEVENQRKFFGDLKTKLRNGEITLEESSEWEELIVKTEDEIIDMTDHEYFVYMERQSLANELYRTRKEMEKKTIRDKIINDLLAERELKHKAQSLSLSEQDEMEKRLQRAGF